MACGQGDEVQSAEKDIFIAHVLRMAGFANGTFWEGHALGRARFGKGTTSVVPINR